MWDIKWHNAGFISSSEYGFSGKPVIQLPWQKFSHLQNANDKAKISWKNVCQILRKELIQSTQNKSDKINTK